VPLARGTHRSKPSMNSVSFTSLFSAFSSDSDD
jgi:hypothetical protein